MLQAGGADMPGRSAETKLRAWLWFAAAVSLAAAGCAALVVGAGAGAGAYSYVQGELIRSYPASYTEVMRVCRQILDDLGMPVLDTRSDGDRTLISSERKDGTPMTIKVRIINLEVTEVGIRTGRVGIWDREASASFHEFIAARLKTAAGAGAAPG
jgi:hypothetical protein